jgi:hypothetical protein
VPRRVPRVCDLVAILVSPWSGANDIPSVIATNARRMGCAAKHNLGLESFWSKRLGVWIDEVCASLLQEIRSFARSCLEFAKQLSAVCKSDCNWEFSLTWPEDRFPGGSSILWWPSWPTTSWVCRRTQVLCRDWLLSAWLVRFRRFTSTCTTTAIIESELNCRHETLVCLEGWILSFQFRKMIISIFEFWRNFSMNLYQWKINLTF